LRKTVRDDRPVIQGGRMAEEPMPSAPPRRLPVALLVFVAVAGAVLGALVVGSIWLLGGDGNGPDVSGSTPDRVGDYARIADTRMGRNDRARQLVERTQDWDRRSAERLSAAHQGAEAAVATYADDNLEEQFSVLVVAARTPWPPFVPYQDAATLRLTRPPNEVREFGDVACVVRNDPTPAGSEERPNSTHVIRCLRTASRATVEITNVTGDLANDPQKVAGLVDDAWAKLN
jgi:hypothetical protein